MIELLARFGLLVDWLGDAMDTVMDRVDARIGEIEQRRQERKQ